MLNQKFLPLAGKKHLFSIARNQCVEKGIVLTGGGAMLREMDSVLREATGLPISIAEEPLFCVVMGTGRCLEELKTLRHVLIGA